MKNPRRVLISGIIVATIAGCASMAAPPAPTASSPAPFEVVTLPGTGDSQDVLRALAQGYAGQYPGRQVVVPNSIGSDGGVKIVGTGESPIGRVARQPNSEEQAQYGVFTYIEFARVPVAFVVSPQTGVRHLSEQQMCDIFSGRMSNWKEVGGNDVAIDVQSRPLGSNLLTIRKNIACFAQLEFAPRAHYNEHNADLVASMQSSAGAIGFMPLSEAERYGYPIVTLDGVAPHMLQYKLGIGLGFVYQKPLPPSVQVFVDYLKTAPAQEIMRQTGHVPIEG